MGGNKIQPVKVGGMVWRSRKAFCKAIQRNPESVYYNLRKFPDTDFNVLAAALWEDYKRGNPTGILELFEKATGKKPLDWLEFREGEMRKKGKSVAKPVHAGGRTWPSINQFCKEAHSTPGSMTEYEHNYPDKTLDEIAQVVWDARNMSSTRRRAAIRRMLDGGTPCRKRTDDDKAAKQAERDAFILKCDAVWEMTPKVIQEATKIFRKMVIRGGPEGEIVVNWTPKETGEGRVTFYGWRFLKWTIDLNRRVLECSYLDGEPRIWDIPDDDEEVDEDDEP